MLVKSSPDTNLKLVAVARWLTGEAIARRAEARGPGTPDDGTEHRPELA